MERKSPKKQKQILNRKCHNQVQCEVHPAYMRTNMLEIHQLHLESKEK